MIATRTFLASAALLLLAMAGAMLLTVRPRPVVVRTNLERLPGSIAGYAGSDDRFPESVTRELNADHSLYRHYRSGDGSQLDLYIGYYGTAKGGRTGHNPYACLPGAGWAIVDTGRVRVGEGAAAPQVNYVLARREGINTVMLHWYQGDGGSVMSSGIRQNLERFKGRLLRNRSDGAFVQVTTLVSDDQVADALGRLTGFAGRVVQLLPGYWPVER